MSPITVRRPEFEWPETVPVLPSETDRVRSGEMVGLSFTLPYLEPYLIRTMRVASKEVDDPELRADMKAFSGQEAQHYKNHACINDIVRGQFSPAGAAKMRSLEDRLEADYRRFSADKSLAFNLAYAEGFEAMTFALARSALSLADVGDTNPEWATLYAWHLAEEVEHRTVTFDAYDAVVGKYPYRVAVGTWAQGHFLRYLIKMATIARQEAGEADLGALQVTRQAIARNWRNGMIKGTLRALLPSYDPRNVTIPDDVRVIAEMQGVDVG